VVQGTDYEGDRALPPEQGAPTHASAPRREAILIDPEQAAVQRQVEPFEAVIVNNPFAVFLVDATLSLRVVSHGAQQMFEHDRPLIGRSLADVLRAIWPEPAVIAAIEKFRQTLETGVSYAAPAAVVHQSSGAACDWRIDRITLPDSGYGIVCYCHDLTERERWARTVAQREAELRDLTVDLERRVRDRTAALHRANTRLSSEIARREAMQAAQLQSQKLETVGQLTSGIAHDFNNILGAVLGGFAIIEHRTEDPRIRQVVGMGQRAAERGAALIRQLLAFARVQEVVPQCVDLAAAIAEISDLLSYGVRRTVALEIDCAPEAWPALADATQLQSALLNLAHNASDAMQGGGQLRIAVSNAQTDAPLHPPELQGNDAVLIRVSDNGPGMDSETLQRVTEPFFTTKARGKGTGLGLAMVQRFVQQSGGALRIESHVGVGTTFSLYLPRASQADETFRAAQDGPIGDTPAGAAFETLLLVDDDLDLSQILHEGLSDLGFDVLVANDARTALELLRTRSVDIVVTDVDMPDMSGIELAAAIRASGTNIPCLFVTAGSYRQAPTGETLLHKPFSPAGLQYAIRRVLNTSSQRSSNDERLDRLAHRLKSPCTRALFELWRGMRGETGIPLFERFTIDACHEPHRIIVATIDLCKSPIEFTFTQIGSTLRDALGDHGPGTSDIETLPLSGNDTLTAREAAYRRCALTGKPSYEYARIDLGDGYLETFERLLLPFSGDGTLVDHIVGAVVFGREPVRSQG